MTALFRRLVRLFSSSTSCRTGVAGRTEFGLALVGLCVSLLLPAIASAQGVIRANQTPYFRIGVGSSVSETDVSTYAVELYSFQGEAGYQFTRSLGIGAGWTYADYPKANVRNTTMSTVHGLLRWTIFPNKTGTPYFNAGGHATLGGDNPAGGVLFGLGFDYVVSHRVSLFAEATAYGTFPDVAIDSRDDGRATFDGLGFWGVGVRTTMRAAPTKPELLPIEAPDRLYRGTPALFSARVEDDATPPVRYTWSFGDGQDARGMVSENTYPLEGEYVVSVTASNAAGSDTETLRVRVEEPSAPAEIIALRADTLQVMTQQLVRFTSVVEGTAPLGASWDFGDGTAPVVERGSHRYAGDRFIGIVRHDLSQGYTFEAPGTYTVTLRAENTFGESERSVVVDVTARDTPAPVADLCQQPPPVHSVFFAFDEHTLTRAAKQSLRNTFAYLRQCPETMVRLGGFADWEGTNDYNDVLSARRADAVAAFYAENGLNPDRILVRSFGELPDPCPDGLGAPGCQTHRRVEAAVVLRNGVEPPPILATELVPRQGHTRPIRTASDASRADGTTRSGGWTVVVASMSTADLAAQAARRFEARLQESGHRVVVRPDGTSGRYRVTLETFATAQDAKAVQKRLGASLPSDAWLLEVPEATTEALSSN